MIRVRSLSELTYPKPSLKVAATISIVNREESPVEARRDIINNDRSKNEVDRSEKSESLRREEYIERLSLEEKSTRDSTESLDTSKAATAAYMRDYRARQKFDPPYDDITVKMNQFTCNVLQQTNKSYAGMISSPVFLAAPQKPSKKRKRRAAQLRNVEVDDERIKGKIAQEMRMRDRRAKQRAALRNERQGTRSMKKKRQKTDIISDDEMSLDDMPLEKRLREVKEDEEEEKTMSSDDEPLEKRLKRLGRKKKKKSDKDSPSDPVQKAPMERDEDEQKFDQPTRKPDRDKGKEENPRKIDQPIREPDRDKREEKNSQKFDETIGQVATIMIQ